MTKVGAILLDTRSIQKYVFASNKLKTNAGASYIVDDIFTHKMRDVLNDMNLKQPAKIDSSYGEIGGKSEPLKMLSDDSIECEIAYIGGGNMLILLRLKDEHGKVDLSASQQKGKEIVGVWSKELLLKAPGLKTGAAIGVLDLDEDKFKDSLDALYKQLKENQNTILSQVDLPYTGLTLECDTSGKTADINMVDYYDGKKEKRWISSEVAAKLNAFKYASDKLNKKYKDILSEKSEGVGGRAVQKYEFANEFDRLGYKEGESYISVIHIDGNNMGVKFGNCRSMDERKDLSAKVASIVEDGFRKVVSSIVREYDSYSSFLDMEKLFDGETHLNILPIRPIIIGGDDVTFVCPGRMGITYAKRFIEAVNGCELLDEEQHEYMSKKAVISRNMSCCGGIAIVPAKYPFFRAYKLAERLCSIAKAKSRKDDNSLIDFAILHGDMYSSIDDLRRDQYEGVEGSLHYGPYSIDKNLTDKSNLKDLLDLMRKLNKVPKNKVKKLREVLTQDQHSIIRYLELSDEVRSILKEESSSHAGTAEEFWWKKKNEKLKTRYIDAIEIMDFMPVGKETE